MSTNDDCGTYAGYQRHFRQGETPCEACKSASAAYHRARRQTPAVRAKEQHRKAATQRALARLARIHPALYRALYEEELSKP